MKKPRNKQSWGYRDREMFQDRMWRKHHARNMQALRDDHHMFKA